MFLVPLLCMFIALLSTLDINISNAIFQTTIDHASNACLPHNCLLLGLMSEAILVRFRLAFLLLHRCPVAPRQTWHGWWCARSCCFLPSLGKHNVGKYQLALILYIVIWMDLIICCTWLQGTMGAHLRRNHPVLLHHHRG